MHAQGKIYGSVLILVLLLCLAACGDNSVTAPKSTTTSPTQVTGVATTTGSPVTNVTTNTVVTPVSSSTAEAVIKQFVEAANRGDAEAVAKTFAPDARFDSVGRIYQGREQIMSRFLVPEVLNIGGKYEILKISTEPAAVTFEFNFRAGSLFEHFTYRCVVKDGLIQDVVGRYIQAVTTTVAANTTTTAAQLNPAVSCYVEAVNSQNLAGLVECFASDGLVIDVTRRISSQEAIRNWARNEVIGGKLEVLQFESSANRNRVLVHWAPAGSNGWKAWYTFDFKDGKITQADLQYA